MIKLIINLPDGQCEERTVPKGTAAEEIATWYSTEHRILAARLNHKAVRMNEALNEDGTLDLLDMRDPGANMSYQTSLTLLYLKAVHDVCGRDTSVMIANSLSKGVFTRLKVSAVTDEMAQQIQKRMEELRDEDVPVSMEVLNREEAIAYLEQNGPSDELKLYRSTEELDFGYLCTLEDETALFYELPVPSAGYLEHFEVRRYRSGILLRFPHMQKPGFVPEYREQKLLYEAFSEETQWEKLMGVSYAGDLNRSIQKNEINDLIMLSEALHEKKIAQIAGMIKEQKKRIVLIAGPSSSGKTSFAKRLCIQLRVIGLKPLYLGTDDYFVNRADVPFEADGKQNFEDLSAVDTDLLAKQMNDLLEGKKVDLPEYNFISGEKEFGKRILSISQDQPIVIEGIHGLNPELTEGIPEEQKFRIYISPLTQLNIDKHHRIPTTDARMLRRMIRDNRTRGTGAEKTILNWQEVRRGEEKNIFPYCDLADVFFNSQCLYELAVLKKHAEPLLEAIGEESNAYPEAQRMLRFLSFFNVVEDQSIIANNSILREFIGGSILVN